jgi:hypothetical protein
LGFGSLRTLEGQFVPLGGCTLLSVVQTYGWDHRSYALQIVQRMYVGPSDIHFFLEYPLVYTWMYEAPFGSLGKNHRTFTMVGWTFAAFQRVGGKPLL